jgi:NAD(P)-dependent dehydrogenase (short-subunit alcohol dehydrogenase family)
MFDLSGMTALVTGGSRGLGYEMAAALAGQGADVLICSRNGDDVRAACERLQAETGRSVAGTAADVTRVDDIRALAGTARDRLGRVDILVNNAGAGLRKPLLELTDDDWERIVRVCLDGPFLVSRAIVPGMLARGFGRVINISSSLGSIALPDRGAYCAAKGGLIQLTRVMALEWAEHGVTANAICPGPFRTPYNLRLQENPELYASYLRLIPMGRWGDLGEIRGAVVFLASREASFVNGSTLYVDGGWTAHGGIPLPGARDPDA